MERWRLAAIAVLAAPFAIGGIGTITGLFDAPPASVVGFTMLVIGVMYGVSLLMSQAAIRHRRETYRNVARQLRTVIEVAQECVLAYEDLARIDPECAEAIELAAADQRARIRRMQDAVVRLEAPQVGAGAVVAADARGQWAAAHTAGTGHDRWFVKQGWPSPEQVAVMLAEHDADMAWLRGALLRSFTGGLE